MGIKHDDVKASGEKGFAAEWNKNHVIDSDVNMLQNSWENQVIENLGAFPGGPVEGQIVWRSDLNKLYIWNGAAWEDFAQHTFNTDDFSVAALAVSLKNKTSYVSIPGTAFLPSTETMQLVRSSSTGYIRADTAGQLLAPVNLPHGAVITAVVVYGNDTGENWSMQRRITNGGGSAASVAGAAMNTEDTSINNATVDNSTYNYNIWSSTPLDPTEIIYGARITYTTDYD